MSLYFNGGVELQMVFVLALVIGNALPTFDSVARLVHLLKALL